MLSRTVRFAYAFALAFPLALAHPAAAAQPRKGPAEAPAPREIARDRTEPLAVATIDADDTRRQLEETLKAYPSTLPRILRMDPTLLDNAGYLQPYPATGVKYQISQSGGAWPIWSSAGHELIYRLNGTSATVGQRLHVVNSSWAPTAITTAVL